MNRSEATARARPLMECGVSAITHTGEEESGDLYLIKGLKAGVLLAVVDGAGHGSEAAAAARIAIATLEADPEGDVVTLMRRCHEELKATRGVVMSLASFNGRENTMTWVGVGNIEGVVLRNAKPNAEGLLMRAGVLGYRLPALQAQVTTVSPDDVLILATDGIRCDFAELRGTEPAEAPEQLAERIAANHAKGTDDGLVLVARYLGGMKA